MKKLLLTLLSVTFLSFNTFAKKPTTVVIETEYGKIEMILYDNTPKHKENFIKLCKEHTLDGTLFHRVIPEFMIQGGDPNSKNAKPGEMLGNGDLGYKVDAEINDENYHKYGALAAARDNDPTKASSACQFYIVVGKKFDETALQNIANRTGKKYTDEQKAMYKTKGGTPHLDNNYTVYGEVTKGMDIVEKIVKEPRDKSDRPNKDIRMTRVYLKKKKFLGIF
ncbi:MAG: peptidylprolyl isomerase [Flavipsychrobacter sp.]|nr:peptidylprolyl isomerase [Flavipsychrobacter sp.]